jgi:hypothetical protein
MCPGILTELVAHHVAELEAQAARRRLIRQLPAGRAGPSRWVRLRLRRRRSPGYVLRLIRRRSTT